VSTTQTTYLQAELALAAYSVLRKGPTGLAENLRALQGDGRGLTVKQAEEFALRYPEVVVQVNDAGSGLSMTVFRGVDGGVALAIRGSEPELADWLPTNFNIAINGAGYQQIVALYNAWQRLTHLHGESITVYDVDLSNSANPVVARTVVNDLGTAQAPLVLPGAAVDVAGHSLGGHLAMAFAGLFPINARQVHAFNAPGFTDSALNRTFFARLGGQLPVGTSPAGVPTVNVIAHAQSGEGQSFSPVAGLHSRPGTPLDIAIENQAPPTDEPSPVSGIWNHSQMVLTDSLAVYDLLSQLSQGLGTAEYKAILNQSVRGTAASYERVIDALEALFGANREWLPAGNAKRDDLYRAIYALQGNSLFVSLSGQLRVLPSGAADALAKAQQMDAEGLAYRYALKELNPFVVAGSAALYVPHNASGELELFVDAASTPAGMTEGYLADRAQMLEFLMLGNTNDTAAFASNQVAGQVLYRDLALRSVAESSDGKPTEVNVYLAGGTPNPRGPNTRTIGFGTNAPDVLQGRDNADRLYGGQGADLLAGGKGDDYLEGGAGLDVYRYSGKRPFLGEASNDGADEIFDTDGKGVIRYTFTQGGLLSDTVQSTVIGGAGIKVSDTEWRSPDGRFTYLRQFSGLRVVINGDAGGSLFIQGFDFDKAQAEGQFGIKLLEAAAWPSFAALPLPQTQGQPIVGDLEPLVQTGLVPALQVSDNPPTWVPDLSGHPDWRLKAIIDVATGSAGPVSFTIEYYQADANGNLIRTSTPAPGLNFFLYDGAGNDSINAGSGNNFVFATRGGDDQSAQGARHHPVYRSRRTERIAGGRDGAAKREVGIGKARGRGTCLTTHLVKRPPTRFWDSHL
jgi:pimeloyl-ACP methyl ester carboxylesterase